jgi:hypothetical protein
MLLTSVPLQVEQGFLAEHNAFRAEVNRPPLTWDTELAQVSMLVCACMYRYNPYYTCHELIHSMHIFDYTHAYARLKVYTLLEHYTQEQDPKTALVLIASILANAIVVLKA